VKRYFRSIFTPELGVGEGEIYSEFDGEGATRQVERYGDCWLYSGDLDGYCAELDFHAGLSDQPLSECDLSNTIEISKEEFEAAWSKAQELSRRQES
jgi:hypothetical protein